MSSSPIRRQALVNRLSRTKEVLALVTRTQHGLEDTVSSSSPVCVCVTGGDSRQVDNIHEMEDYGARVTWVEI